MKPHVVCSRDKEITALTTGLARIEGKLDNGLSARVKNTERLQYWQMGALVMIIGVVLFGLWYFTTRTLEANAALMQQLERVVQSKGRVENVR